MATATASPPRRRASAPRHHHMADDLDQQTPAGAAVDFRGRLAADPTKNVLDLVDAAIERQDDLRGSESLHIRELMVLQGQAYTAETAHVRELMQLRAGYERELRMAESARLDSIRSVDVDAVSRAAVVAATQAGTLATQVATSAETLRGQVGAAAVAAATALGNALEPIQKSIDDLRRAQYEAQGSKTTVTESKTDRSGNYALILSAVSVLIAIIVAVILIVKG